MATKTACGAMLLAVAAAAMVFAAPASAGSNGKGKGAPWLRGHATAQKTDQGRHGRTDIRITRRKGCIGKTNGRTACADRRNGGTVWVRDHDDGVLSDGIFYGLPPGLGKRDSLPPGLARQGHLPPGLAKGHGVPPGLAKQWYLPPGLSR